jgi:hypothetical protein
MEFRGSSDLEKVWPRPGLRLTLPSPSGEISTQAISAAPGSADSPLSREGSPYRDPLTEWQAGPAELPGRGVASTATILLGGFICLQLVTAVVLWLSYRIELGGRERDFSAEEREGLNMLAEGFTIVVRVAFLATVIAFCRWIYVARKNLDLLNVEGLRYSAAWAVGSFFVPVLNLFQPYQIVQEIWKGSSPEGKLRERSAWLNVNDSPLIICWWAVGLTTVIAPLLFRGFTYFGGIYVSPSVFYVVDALRILGVMVAGICALAIIVQIQQRQRRRYQRLLDFARHGRLAG